VDGECVLESQNLTSSNYKVRVKHSALEQARRKKDNERASDGHGMVTTTSPPLSLSGRPIALRRNVAKDHSGQ
jgi:hypothetical protein